MYQSLIRPVIVITFVEYRVRLAKLIFTMIRTGADDPTEYCCVCGKKGDTKPGVVAGAGACVDVTGAVPGLQGDTCADLAAECKHPVWGAILLRECPRTCGVCGQPTAGTGQPTAVPSTRPTRSMAPSSSSPTEVASWVGNKHGRPLYTTLCT